jgi:gliding motility-associated-like protein
VDNTIQEFTDSDLEYDWGGYWYSVFAYENQGLYNATSRSNDIYLIQPPLVFVPNALTANGDNLNDYFRWSDVFVKEFEMLVFNRWGEKVYQTMDKNDNWSGEFKESEFGSSNVYFWILTYKGWDNITYRDNGTLTIVK